ncbi:MAG: HD domain-containing protein [Anaerolineae bacterium]|jgi:tRNA nucleotidyltransferase/poly(A) polymerase
MDTYVSLPEWPLGRVRAIAQERGVQVWPVGGAVRDALLGRTTHDWDFAVEHEAMELARAVGDALGGAFYPLDEERDTGRVVLDQGDDQQFELDFAGLRGPDLEADLLGRDFTINAMAVEEDGRLIDPVGGAADLQARLIRVVDEVALDDDPLRMLRAVRLAAQLSMQLEAKTAAWIIQRTSSLSLASSERVRDELVRLMAAPAVADHLHILDELGLMVQILPEVDPLKEQAQSPPHRFDVWWHTLLVVEAVEGVLKALSGSQPRLAYVDAPQRVWGDLREALAQLEPKVTSHMESRLKGGRTHRVLLFLAALCHDLGKPLTCTEDEQGRLHFYSHGPVGARIAAEWMERLRFSRAEIAEVRTMVRDHLRPAHLAQAQGRTTRRAVYRFFRATEGAGVGVVLLSLADHVSSWGPNLEAERWARRLEVAQTLLAHYFEHQNETISPDPLVDGHDLMAELGLEEGPRVGWLLRAIQEAQAAGEVSTREEALALGRRLADGE